MRTFYDPHFGASYVFYSDDDGRTWRRNRDGELFIIIEPGGQMEATFEPSVTEVQPGNLLMVMRTRVGRYFQAWSHDDGETWTRPQPTQLAGTHSPAQVRTLKGSGHLLCVFTPAKRGRGTEGVCSHPAFDRDQPQPRRSVGAFPELEAISEETHVEPGPIRIVRPAGAFHERDRGISKRSGRHRFFSGRLRDLDYPSVMVLTDRVLISYPYSWFDKTGPV